MMRAGMLRGTAALFMLASLASCGGGGDIAGDSSEFAVSPEKGTLTITSVVENDCTGAAGDPGTVVTIVGGQAPFRIVNSDPARVSVDKTEVTGKDPKFTARATGYACGEVVITVLDYHSQVVTYTYKIEAKKPESTG